MFKKRKFYNLSDIKKHLIFTPLIFVFISAIVSIIVTTFVLEFKKNNEISLVKQEDTFQKDKILTQFIDDIKFNASASFDSEEIALREAVISLYGFINYVKEDIKIDKIREKIKEIENNTDFEFVLFKKDSDDILYGQDIIDYLKTLTGSSLEISNFRHHMLRNISYIGVDNLFYWIDKEKRKIRLSYFKLLDKKNLYLGAFSKIDDMKETTRKVIENSIVQKSKYYNDSYFWFYDYSSGYVFNYYNKGKKLNIDYILKNDTLNSSNKILEKYNKDVQDSSSVDTYDFRKYNYLVSIKSNFLPAKVSQIKFDYNSKLSVSIAVIGLISLFLIVASSLFAKFINKIFHRYNKRLETRNIMYKKWKERYELAIIASNDGLWDIDLKTKHIYFSKKWLDMFGYEDGDINTLNEWFDLIHKDDVSIVRQKFETHLQGKSEHFICEYRIKDKSNKFKWIFVRGKAFDDNHHKRMLMMSMDIEQRKKLTKELQYVDLLVEYGRIVIFKWKNDENLTVEYLSKSISSYGYIVEDFESKRVKYFDFVYEEDVKDLVKDLNTAMKNDDKSFTKFHRVKDKDGEIRWVFNRTIFLKDDFGNITHLYGYVNDITEMKLTEEELKQKINEEVAKNIEKDRILVQQSKLAAMGEMLGNIAHQWRQPLNNINLLIHFIRDSYGTLSKEEVNDIIKDSKVQIDYMSQTIDDFRNFYQPNKDKIEFDIKEALIECSNIVETQLEKYKVLLKIDGDSVNIFNYKNEFEQVILNILNNANDAAKVKKEEIEFDPVINITIKRKDDSVEITLSNNCGEIPSNIIDRIFEPYFTTKFENQGTGIGLYMAKTIIEKNMNGKISVKNIKEGVLFTIYLPL
ncbi:PAS domain-containing protein [Halarcobacter sp.]|uniref:PAS domain-containing sensor histidine kinase n=1 Tax=Halarcobacter sp. TaxID=2321133 RepID=UPI002AAB6997|nr:PAS domain-containing protein [Halarcobacter sp.]